MEKAVIFVESPNKAPHIAEYSGMDCVATYGHFGDLPEKDLGINLQSYELTFEYKERIVQAIRRLAQGRDVYLAGDPDREGFAISSMIAGRLEGVRHGKMRLLEIHSVDKEGVAKALAKAIPWESANHNREKAFRARRGVDRLIGYILSGKAREHFQQPGYSVGRLQSPALRIVVERAREIQNFKPVEFWRVFVVARSENDGNTFALEFSGGRFTELTTANALVAKIKGNQAPGRVVKLETKPVTKNAPAPFTMSTMTQAANARLGLTTKEAASIAQALFEGGFITYPRGDSVRIEPEPLEAIRQAIKATFGAGALPETPNAHVSENSQADAHEAIRPTRIVPLAGLPAVVEEIKKAGLGQRHCDLFMMIYARALASQMRPAQYEKTSIEAEFAGESFKTSGSVLREVGFLKLYQDDQQEHAGVADDREQDLPALAEGQKLHKDGEEIKRGETKPPAYHTEGTLVRELEKKRIGRPSTYSPAVEVLKTRGYAILGTGKQKKYLLPTGKGYALIGWLESDHPWLMDYDYTRKLEAMLDQVEAGKLEWTAIMREVHERLGFVDPRNSPRISIPRESLGKCPKCDGEIHEYPKFFGCGNWQQDKSGCTFKIWKNVFGASLSAATARTLLAGKQTKSLKLKRKNGTPFEARLGLKEGQLEPIFEQ